MSWIKSFQVVLFALLIVAERCTNACAQGKLPELIREPIKNDDQPLLEQRMITFLDMLNRFPKKYCVKSTYSRLAVFDEDSKRALRDTRFYIPRTFVTCTSNQPRNLSMTLEDT